MCECVRACACVGIYMMYVLLFVCMYVCTHVPT